jgi:hypothetical protein
VLLGFVVCLVELSSRYVPCDNAVALAIWRFLALPVREFFECVDDILIDSSQSLHQVPTTRPRIREISLPDFVSEGQSHGMAAQYASEQILRAQLLCGWKKCLTQSDNRTRRIKCDEARPQCNKCTSTGRKCEGHLTGGQRRKKRKSVNGMQEVQVPGSVTLYNPSVNIGGSAGERRSFQYFQSRNMSDMPGNFELSFRNRMVLQFSHRYPAVQQSLVALSAIYEENDRDNRTRCRPVTASVDAPQALHQYNKALRHLVEHLSSTQEDVRVTLISYLILVWIEILQNKLDAAFNI